MLENERKQYTIDVSGNMRTPAASTSPTSKGAMSIKERVRTESNVYQTKSHNHVATAVALAASAAPSPASRAQPRNAGHINGALQQRSPELPLVQPQDPPC